MRRWVRWSWTVTGSPRARPDPAAVLPARRRHRRSVLQGRQRLGTPAYTVTQLQHSNPAVQGAADAQLLTDRQVELAPVSTVPSPRGIVTGLEGAVNGSIARHGACVGFMPTAAQAPGEASRLALALNPGRVAVTAGAARPRSPSAASPPRLPHSAPSRPAGRRSCPCPVIGRRRSGTWRSRAPLRSVSACWVRREDGRDAVPARTARTCPARSRPARSAGARRRRDRFGPAAVPPDPRHLVLG